MSFLICRHQEGITINPLEYLRDNKGNLLKFETEKLAKSFLKSLGLQEAHLDTFKYLEVLDDLIT